MVADIQHVVFTYHDPDLLQPKVGDWLAGALACGGGALVACTGPHAALVRTELARRGLDVAACEAEGRLLLADADGLLARFMIAGMPHGRSFKRIARQLLGSIRAAGAAGPIRAWGEMVNVLAQRGDHDAAHRLECLWNEILAEEDVELLCSYELDSLDAVSHARVLLDACATHTRLDPEEGSATLDAAVAHALADVFGPDQAPVLLRVLPTRARLRERMCAGSAILVSLRALDPDAGARLHASARTRLRSVTTAAATAPQ